MSTLHPRHHRLAIEGAVHRGQEPCTARSDGRDHRIGGLDRPDIAATVDASLHGFAFPSNLHHPGFKAS